MVSSLIKDAIAVHMYVSQIVPKWCRALQPLIATDHSTNTRARAGRLCVVVLTGVRQSDGKCKSVRHKKSPDKWEAK